MKRQWFKAGTAEEKKMCKSHNEKDIAFYMQARKRLIGEFKSLLPLYEIGKYAPVIKGKRR